MRNNVALPTFICHPGKEVKQLLLMSPSHYRSGSTSARRLVPGLVLLQLLMRFSSAITSELLPTASPTVSLSSP